MDKQYAITVEESLELGKQFNQLGKELAELKGQYEASSRGQKGKLTPKIKELEAEQERIGRLIFVDGPPSPMEPGDAWLEIRKWLQGYIIKADVSKKEFLTQAGEHLNYAVEWKLDDALLGEAQARLPRQILAHLEAIEDVDERITESEVILGRVIEELEEGLIDNASFGIVRSSGTSDLIREFKLRADASLLREMKKGYGNFRQAVRAIEQVKTWREMKRLGVENGE